MRQLRAHRRRTSPILAVMSAILSMSALAQQPAAPPPGAQVIPPASGAASAQAMPPPEVTPHAQAIPPPGPALVRITSSFEVKHAGAVLKKVAKVFRAGFVRKDAESVARDIDTLPAEQSRRWEFSVNYKGASYPLQIRARLDDFGMLDLDFFCAASAAGPVREAVDGYLNSHAL
jgi:hypothetical protein